MRKNLIFISSIVLSVIFFSASIFAQSQFGEIQGTVTDPNGAVVPNASVTLTGVSIGLTRTTSTDSDGHYVFRQLPPGSYNIAVGAVSGFAARTLENQTVVLETSTTADVKVAIAGAGVTVDVSSDDVTPPVDATESKRITSITAAKIALLPKGVGFQSILKTAPGTRGESKAGGITVDGASGSENTFYIDGQDVTNFRTGTLNAVNDIPLQIIQEVQLKSSGFEAQFGGATGGVVTVVTKGGSNDLHGEFGTGFTTSKLNGNPKPTQQRFIAGSGAGFTQAVEYFNYPKPTGHSFFPTANLTGPIIKDKLWFSGSYSPQIFSSSYTTAFFTNQAAATRTYRFSEAYTAENRFEYAFARLDAQPFSKLRLSSTYLWNPQINKGVLPFDTMSFGGTPASIDFGGSIGRLAGEDLYIRQGGRVNSNNFTAQASYTPLSNLIMSFRLSRGFLNEKGDNYFVPTATRYICQAGSTTVAGACANGLVDPANSQTKRDISIRTNYEGDATFFINRGVRQEIKGGYQRFRIKNDVDRGYIGSGRIDSYYGYRIDDLGSGNDPTCVNNTTGAIAPCQRNAAGDILNYAPFCSATVTANCTYGAGYLIRFGTKGVGQNTNQSVYIQDKVQFGGRVTVNAGVRFEKEDLPAFNNLAPPINFGWGDKIAPRLGVAVALNSQGTSKIFASYGEFFDRLKFELPRGSFGGDFYRLDFFEIAPFTGGSNFRNYTRANILGSFNDAAGGSCPATGFIAPGAYSRCQFDYRIASNNPNATIFDGKVDPAIHPFQQREFTVGFQHELSRNYVFSSRYTRKNVIWAIEDAGVRNNAGSEAYILGNPGSGLHLSLLNSLGYAKSTKPQRLYNGVDVALEKRLTHNYYFNVNYTWSRLFGNYSGLASSDENGRTSPGVNRFFDLPFLGFTAEGHPDNGLLATDRTHVVNAYGAYIFDWKGSKTNSTTFSFYQTVQSGTPQTTFIGYITSVIFTKRGDLGRSPTFSQTDYSMSHKYRFGKDTRFAVAGDLNIINLFNQSTVLGVQNILTGVTLRPQTFGLNEVDGSNAFVNGTLLGPINTYLQGTSTALNRKRVDFNRPNSYQGPRSVRFGLRFIF